MAGFASQAALRSKWGDLVDTGANAVNLPEPSEAITGLKNWLKQVFECDKILFDYPALLFDLKRFPLLIIKYSLITH